MTLTEKFQALEVGEQIGLLLALAVVAVPLALWAWTAFVAYCERQPIYDPLVHGPQPTTTDEHIAKLAPLHAKWVEQPNQTVGTGPILWDLGQPVLVSHHPDALAVQRQMAADTIKGKRP